MFSLVNKPGWAPVKLSPPGASDPTSNKHAIKTCPHFGPNFGIGQDLRIVDQAASNTESYAYIGHSYSGPSGHATSSTFSQTFLAGTLYFQPDEVEVFYETT